VSEGTAARDGRAKPLSLTDKGRAALAAIDRFAKRQVVDAIGRIGPAQRQTVVEGLRLYADALAADRLGVCSDCGGAVIETGYQPGVLARCVEMQALYYARTAGFALAFETKVAAGMADFCARLERPDNQLWRATREGRVVGAVAIDGEDLGPGRAHLRWFIVDEGARGGGIGRRLLSEAVAFCDRSGFAETHLWTLRGLEVARRLYEAEGFELTEEWLGRQWGAEVVEQRFLRKANAGSAARAR
jgi:GNAT superfamily N-acetyltransferase